MLARSPLAFVCVALVACSGAAANKDATPDPNDAGAKVPQTPEDVVPVRLEAEASACPTPYDSAAPKSGLNRTFKIAGQNREFVLMLPPDSFTGPRPLFVGFNGTGGSGPEFVSSAGLADFAKAGFIVVAPSSNGNGTVWPVWDGMRTADTEGDRNKDLEFFDALVKCTAAHFEVDKNRVYVGGHSAGGIFTNYVAQRRSELLAGAIPASGMFSSTSPEPVVDLDKMFVLVTWGGDNDKFSSSVPGFTIPEANFSSEASVATHAYAAQRNVGAANCHGNKLGHVWLPINEWFIKTLLAHPKGFPGADHLELLPVDDARITCSTEPFEFKSPPVTCAASAKAGCQETCQFFGDCAVENGTVGPALKPQLTAIGFAGTDCGGCLSTCATKSDGPDDATVLACLKTAQATAQCGGGIDGAQPLIKAVNACCGGKRTTSKYCDTVCTAIANNALASTYFTACQ